MYESLLVIREQYQQGHMKRLAMNIVMFNLKMFTMYKYTYTYRHAQSLSPQKKIICYILLVHVVHFLQSRAYKWEREYALYVHDMA